MNLQFKEKKTLKDLGMSGTKLKTIKLNYI